MGALADTKMASPRVIFRGILKAIASVFDVSCDKCKDFPEAGQTVEGRREREGLRAPPPSVWRCVDFDLGRSGPRRGGVWRGREGREAVRTQEPTCVSVFGGEKPHVPFTSPYTSCRPEQCPATWCKHRTRSAHPRNPNLDHPALNANPTPSCPSWDRF
jgi:hypothetical protein